MIEQIWRDKGIAEGTINPEATALIEQQLWKGVVKGYGFGLEDIAYDTPDFNMLQALKQNVSHFSHAKNYHQLRELTDALLDDAGTLRTRAAFMEAAAKINEAYISRYLAVEYELAVAGAQMAGKWVDITRNADTLPLLQFDAVLDAQTTALCKSLDGIIVPITHPYVKKYYPPNHYGCRLTVKQLASGKVTPDDQLPYPEIPKMFSVNLGEQQLIFPADHPYFIDLPESLKPKAQ